MSFKDKVALITGASGALGAAISRALHEKGATIVISGTRQEALDTLKADLGHDRVIVHPCSLQDPAAVDALIPDVCTKTGRLDILVNNAGITRDGLIMRMKDEDWDDVLAVNLSATFRLCRAASKVMMRQRFGRIINITSIVGVTGNPGQANYCAAKAGLIGLSKSMAQELATRGITVNCVAPGFIASPMTDVLSDKARDALLEGIPQKRIGTPEDIAFAVAFLADENASYVTGHTLHVNGGMAMI